MFASDVPAVEPTAVGDEALLLDVREPDEWAAGHVPAAVHIPLGQLVARLSEVPVDRDLVVVCRSGARSAQATAYLNQAGRKAVNLDGGMQAWAAAGLPMVSESATSPQVI